MPEKIIPYSAIMVPRVEQFPRPDCLFSKVRAEFLSPLDFTMQFHIANTVADPIPQIRMGDEIFLAIEISDFAASLNWFLKTTKVFVTNSVLQFELTESNIQDATITGSLELKILEDGSLNCFIQGHLASEPTMPFNSGGTALPYLSLLIFNVLEISPYGISGFVLGVTLANAHWNTTLLATPTTLLLPFFELRFADHRLAGNITVDVGKKPPLGVTTFFGLIIQFADQEGSIKALLYCDSVVDTLGNVTAFFAPISFINDSKVTGYVTGSWNCNTLELTFEDGKVLASDFQIPTYSTSITGTITIRD